MVVLPYGRVWVWLLAAVAAATMAAALGGCSGGGGGLADDPPAATPPAATTLPPARSSVDDSEVEPAVLAAYVGMWEAYESAGQPPAADPGSPVLARYAAGEALDALVNGLVSMRGAGLVFQGRVVFAPEVVEVSPASVPARARVEDCADSTGSARVRADGAPFADEPGGLRRIVAELERGRAGGWKVTSFAVLEVGSCPSINR